MSNDVSILIYIEILPLVCVCDYFWLSTDLQTDSLWHGSPCNSIYFTYQTDRQLLDRHMIWLMSCMPSCGPVPNKIVRLLDLWPCIAS